MTLPTFAAERRAAAPLLLGGVRCEVSVSERSVVCALQRTGSNVRVCLQLPV